MVQDVSTVLAPADCSDEAEESVRIALAVADTYGADLHLLHVLDERLARGLAEEEVRATTVADQFQEFATLVREWLDEHDGVGTFSTSSAAGFSASRLAQTPGSVILDVADETDADFIVLPRGQSGSQPGETLGKSSLYVLEYASQPVLSV